MPTYTVKWEIDVEADSPRQAAEQVWIQNFNRRVLPPGPDGCCCFTVIADNADGTFFDEHQIDLYEDEL